MNKYFNLDYILSIATKIQMPTEAIRRMEAVYPTIDEQLCIQIFKQLTKTETMHEAAARMKQTIYLQENGQWICLLIYLAATGKTHEYYREKGICDKIYYDTMDCFREYVQTYKDGYGEWGFEVITWPVRQINGILFQLGRLGFEMCTFPFEDVVVSTDRVLKKGDPILSVHIPANGKLDYDACKQAYLQAKEFFKTNFFEFQAEYFYCGSWLLHPALHQLLPPQSNILKFQGDYQIFKVIQDNDAILKRVFGKLEDHLNDYQAETSLQKNIISFLKQGNNLGEGFGYMVLD